MVQIANAKLTATKLAVGNRWRMNVTYQGGDVMRGIRQGGKTMRRMRRVALALCMGGVLTLAPGVTLAADPPAAEQSPIGGDHAHRHIVLTPSGCVDIDQVLFEPGRRGMHRAANETGPSKGPWHIFPGLGCEDLG